MKHTLIIVLVALLACLSAGAESITYRIVEYNADAGDFTLAACGQRPVGAYAIFENEFGATRGNRYNQIPRNREATLWLEGWQGCTINSVTLSMCSNNASGTAALSVTSGDATLFTMRAADFASDEWFGHWVSKDLRTYVDVTKVMTQLSPVGPDGEVAITIKGGTPEGSVYLNAVTIDYTPSNGVGTESPLGWVFEKLEAKSTLADGDVVMLYRSGDAAGDIDGMEQSHYLDAIGLASTSNVTEPFVITFTAHTTNDGHWTLTSQYGERLGATSAQALAWDAGVTTWDIALGYSGATIASTNSKYGTLRYNAPAGSYPRFWNYTSTSLPLPYLYRRIRQIEPTISTALAFDETERSVSLAEQDTLVLHTVITPVGTTDRRIVWASSDESIATVKSGIVFTHAPGEAIITATTADGGAHTTCRIIVTDDESGISTPTVAPSTPSTPRFSLDGRRIRPNHSSTDAAKHAARRLYIEGGTLRVNP